ncbi:sensor domain-containing diguanylate cyclase [uncultured Desulfobulbus sp.]|jgi:diguanylate cyclase (GGDEF)-like protein/PAS domain S-box-containing protein|uniref:sensor domain-containing diguanylate cyclase n=1 Tax=uncultured Desulfobulbus sp. TaxID=239745 RepID=UPI002618A193|nr:sensor domain-containing diguanylate cyclase [uncultured Desulfobulbus sp.]
MHLDNVQLADVLENLHDGLYCTDTHRVITFWNHAAERITGYPAAEVLGRSCAANILVHVDTDGRSLCRGLCPLAMTMADCVGREAEVFLRHRDGHRVPVLVRTGPLKDRAGQVVGGVELFTDLSNILANNSRVRELEQLALLDTLTQLANRAYLQREIEARFEEMRRYGIPFGLLFMDIDFFKRFNDTYGHDVGDAVLKLVANTFTANSRAFDVYGRWGGEEFVGVIRSIDAEDLVVLGNRMRVLVNQSFLMHDEARLGVSISLGATVAKPDDTAESLIKRADQLLYRSKKEGRNRLTLG